MWIQRTNGAPGNGLGCGAETAELPSVQIRWETSELGAHDCRVRAAWIWHTMGTVGLSVHGDGEDVYYIFWAPVPKVGAVAPPKVLIRKIQVPK